MDITYLGHSSFKIKTKSAVVVTDPFDSEMVGIKFPSMPADIVTISHDHKDHNMPAKLSEVKKIVEGPGEYEIMGISIIGYHTYHDTEKGAKRGKNTIYLFETEGLRILHLGDLGHQLDEDLINEIGDIDVLMIPVGGEYTIGPKEAVEIVGKIEPFFIIPMHYQATGLNQTTFSTLLPNDNFLKESGLTSENLDKFSIKKEDIIEDQNTKVIVLERKNA